MDFLSLPFTTDFTSIAFAVLLVLAACSIIVWVILFVDISEILKDVFSNLTILTFPFAFVLWILPSNKIKFLLFLLTYPDLAKIVDYPPTAEDITALSSLIKIFL